MNIPYIECEIRFTDEPEDSTYPVIIALTEDLGEDHPNDLAVFYYAGDYPEHVVRERYGERAWREGRSYYDWYIVETEGGAA